MASTVNFLGTLKAAGGVELLKAVEQIVGDLAVSSGELLLAASQQNAPLSWILPGNPLIVNLYAPKTLTLEITSEVAGGAGPVKLGIKGWWFMTIPPGKGPTLIRVSNDNTEAVLLTYFLASEKDAVTTPDFFK